MTANVAIVKDDTVPGIFEGPLKYTKETLHTAATKGPSAVSLDIRYAFFSGGSYGREKVKVPLRRALLMPSTLRRTTVLTTMALILKNLQRQLTVLDLALAYRKSKVE